MSDGAQDHSLTPGKLMNLPRFNPFSAEFRETPYGVYRQLRELNPLHKVLGMWVVTRHADVMSVLRDRSCNASIIPKLVDNQAAKFGRDNAPFQRLAYKSIVFTENPDHHRLRKLMNIAFSQSAIDQLQSSIEDTIQDLLRDAYQQGGMDIISGLAQPTPLRVMCEWIGLPAEMHSTIDAWTHAIRFLLEPGLMVKDDFEKVSNVLDEYMEYLSSVIAERKNNPRQDLISQLLDLQIDGDRLTHEELIFVCIMCFVAGNETTKSLIGNGINALLEHPEQYRLLQQRPQLIHCCVQEVLRFETPLQHTKRFATKELILDGHVIKAGDQILLCLGSANRDERVFPAADRFDIERKTKGHLAFGYGMHGCLGALLAERQMQAVLSRLLEGPRLIRRHSKPTWQAGSFIVRSLSSLDVQFV
ncbi:cytochrome P450 [Pseudomonas sp. F01002]|uniref:cytochrome P450 n=1 Tax=Pseudomonas sp. F01002 TaxID=2555724 RepID=UPI00106AEE8C|nr:cytochrome P450 [Pseudomonas sp. F01002]TFB37823.1 cytochrome P450 [Pseudomonas sp. F01002]